MRVFEAMVVRNVPNTLVIVTAIRFFDVFTDHDDSTRDNLPLITTSVATRSYVPTNAAGYVSAREEPSPDGK